MFAPVDFHRVIVTFPRDRVLDKQGRTIASIGTPDAGAFDPMRVRIVAAEDVKPGDLVVGTCDPYYDRLLNLLDRAQAVGYFVGTPAPQSAASRPLDPGHCDWCAHNVGDCGMRPAEYVVVDGCTAYRRGSLLLAVPAELA